MIDNWIQLYRIVRKRSCAHSTGPCSCCFPCLERLEPRLAPAGQDVLGAASPFRPLSLRSPPLAVAVLDFTYDGSPDIVTVNGNPDPGNPAPFQSGLSVLGGRGNGTF